MNEREKPKSPEQKQSKPFDALLVHAAGYKENPKRLRPSIRGRLQVRAAAELFHQGLVENIILAGGKVWGEEYPSLSEVMKEELQRRFQIPSDNVYLIDQAKDTSFEIDLFLTKAKEMGWRNLLDLGLKLHLPRIRTLLKNRNAQVETINSEEILSQISPRYINYTRKLSWSVGTLTWRFYEGMIRLVMVVDRDGSFFKNMAERRRTKKYRGVGW